MLLERKLDHSPLVSQFHVIRALILRDIRTRFFGHGLGYLVAIAWPLVHILVLLIIYQVMGRAIPYGTSLPLFFATGLVPFMSFIYMARFIMMSIVMNRPLLQLPVVKVLDILFARAILEFLASCCMVLLLLTIFYILGIQTMPRDVGQASAALAASMLFGVGFGIVNAIIMSALPGWMLVFILVQIILYMTSGIVFLAETLPEQVRHALSYNPMFHGVEWMRSAFYNDYYSIGLDKSYLISWGVGSMFVGLVLERLARGRILQG